jgi:DNA (cytosine-5)-methyltransferase 1
LNGKQGEESWQDHYKRLLTCTEKDFADQEQYVVTYQPVNAANYGVPQVRDRVIISAFRRDLNIAPFQLEAPHSREALLINQWVTGSYWEKHSTSPYDYLNSSDKGFVKKLRSQLFFVENKQPWLTTRDAIYDLPTPVERGQKEKMANHTQHPGARIYPGHSGSILDQPAKALKAGVHGVPGGENVLYIHQEDVVRYFTAREAARIQTFPDAWHFHGSWGACMKQPGNAVPAELIRLFAKEINQRLKNVLA